jgi:acetate kinase
MIIEGIAALDIKVDAAANDACFGKAGVISTADSAWKAVVMPTDEELMIAQHTQKIVSNN